MAHYAEIDENNVVLRVIVAGDIGSDEELDSLSTYCSETFGGRWVQTSYNASFRKRYAYPGLVYDTEADMFVHLKPKSWYVLNDNGDWVSPIGIHPDTGIPLADWQWEWLEAVCKLQVPWMDIDWASNVG